MKCDTAVVGPLLNKYFTKSLLKLKRMTCDRAVTDALIGDLAECGLKCRKELAL